MGSSIDAGEWKDKLHAAAAETAALKSELAVQSAAAQDAALHAMQVYIVFVCIGNMHSDVYTVAVCNMCIGCM